MSAKITYVFASRSRPDKFFAAIENIINLSVKEDYVIIASLDSDDKSMNNGTVKNRIKGYKKVSAYYGTSTGKVHAINLNCDKIPNNTDIIIVMSDDMIFEQRGFDDIIRIDMQKYFPNMDGCLHYPDGSKVQERLITLSIMGINFFRRFGYIYNPEYTSLWCDMEFSEIAKKLGKYKYLPDSKIFRHAHPLWTKEPYDALMTRNESFYNSDKEIYLKRLANNFDL